MNENTNFGYSDFSIFGLMLFGSLAIGLYFSLKRKKENPEGDESEEYLVGNRKLSVIPVGISLIASLFSGASMVSVTTEMYLYGYHMVFNLLGFIPAGLLTHYFFLPVLHKMKLVSVYEYLDQRFDNKLRWICSVMFLVNAILKIPVQIFVASVTLNQMTNLNIDLVSWIASLICIIYTCIGGMRAVVWADVLQYLIFYGTLVMLLIRGTILTGGVGIILERLTNTTHLEPPIFNLDPTVRLSFWTCFVGGSINFLTMIIVEQCMVQRFVSLPTLRQAKQALWINIFGNIIAMFTAMCVGLMVYSYYYGCDPLSLGIVKLKDQLLPFFAMEILGKYPLLCGVFVAGVFSASLSSISSWLNSMAAIVLQDIIKPLYPETLSERATSIILRVSVIVFGIISTTLIFVVKKLSHAIVLVLSLHAITFGPVLGIFFVGLFMPWIGSKPTFFAVIFGFIMTSWVVFKTQWDLMNKTLVYQSKPVYVDQCPGEGFNGTTLNQGVDSEREFYHLSFMYHCIFGTLVTVIASNVFCLIFGRLKNYGLNVNLLAPPIRKFVRNDHFDGVPMKQSNFNKKGEITYEPQ